MIEITRRRKIKLHCLAFAQCKLHSSGFLRDEVTETYLVTGSYYERIVTYV
jgi:hypothetical protein